MDKGIVECIRMNGHSREFLVHLLRVLRQDGVNNDISAKEILNEMVGKLGLVETRVFLGHSYEILQLYDYMMEWGYKLEDAIQAFIDGKKLSDIKREILEAS